MTKTLTENLVCIECGSEARGQALYCYHCGSALQPPADWMKAPAKKAATSEAKKTAAADGDGGARAVRSKTPEDEADTVEQPAPPKLRTASAIRKDPTIMRMRRIEVRWVSEEEGPNLWFLVFGLVLTLIVFTVFLISMYLR